ncbi:MAG: glucose repression mediator protein [Chrysothrix sp. TS-e1954]|nr:MAG: glucose repression mediator protein [Chrysothrix sp. TS-e1954]
MPSSFDSHNDTGHWQGRVTKAEGPSRHDDGKEESPKQKHPSALPIVSDYHFFKDGIRPVWEDDENKKGGKWIILRAARDADQSNSKTSDFTKAKCSASSDAKSRPSRGPSPGAQRRQARKAREAADALFDVMNADDWFGVSRQIAARQSYWLQGPLDGDKHESPFENFQVHMTNYKYGSLASVCAGQIRAEATSTRDKRWTEAEVRKHITLVNAAHNLLAITSSLKLKHDEEDLGLDLFISSLDSVVRAKSRTLFDAGIPGTAATASATASSTDQNSTTGSEILRDGATRQATFRPRLRYLRDRWRCAGRPTLRAGNWHHDRRKRSLKLCEASQIPFNVGQHKPKLWYGIGILYDRYGSLDHAEEAFSQVMRMAPDFEKANEIYFRLDIIYKQQMKFPERSEDRSRAHLQTYPQYPLPGVTSLTLPTSPVLLGQLL